MAEQVLFQDASGQLVTRSTLRAALEACGAADADVLFIHSDLTFGQPNLSLGRRGIMAGVLDAVRSLGVGTLIVPTFTFSFLPMAEITMYRRARRRWARSTSISAANRRPFAPLTR